MLYLQSDTNSEGRLRKFWLIGSDNKPNREMRRKLRSDYHERKMANRGQLPSSALVFIGSISAFGYNALVVAVPCLILAILVTVGSISLSMRKSVKVQERIRLDGYLSDNYTRVASLDGTTGEILSRILAGRNIAIVNLTSPEARLVDEYFTGINVVEFDTILSAEGADTNPQCIALRRKLMERANRVGDAIKSLRRELAAADSRLQQIARDDLADQAADAQARLSYAASCALEIV